MTKQELEQRLIDHSVNVLNSIEMIKINGNYNNLKEQLIRSCTSAALNYGEAQSAESKRDFIHKIGVIMKELRETYINLSIMKEITLSDSPVNFENLLRETNELIAIFHKSLQTARKNP